MAWQQFLNDLNHGYIAVPNPADGGNSYIAVPIWLALLAILAIVGAAAFVIFKLASAGLSRSRDES